MCKILCIAINVATGDDILHFCYSQGVSDAFQGVAAPLTLVLLIDVLTTTIHLAITAFIKGAALVALILIITYLVIAIIIMISWTFCAVGYDVCIGKMNKTKCKKVLINIVAGFGGCLYLIGDNLQHLQNVICELTLGNTDMNVQSNNTDVNVQSNNTDVNVQSNNTDVNVTCEQLTRLNFGQLIDGIPDATVKSFLARFSLATYGKVLIAFSVFLFSMFPTCVFKFNTQEETEEIIIEKEENFPVTFTLNSLAMIVEINAWFAVIVTNPAPICPEEEMIGEFFIYGLFVIGWFIIVIVFLIADCRMAGERKRNKPVKLYIIFSMFVLIPSLPIYLLADNDSPLSCVPHLDAAAVGHIRFSMLLVLSVFLTLFTAFTACCQIYLMRIQGNKRVQTKSETISVCVTNVDFAEY